MLEGCDQRHTDRLTDIHPSLKDVFPLIRFNDPDPPIDFCNRMWLTNQGTRTAVVAEFRKDQDPAFCHSNGIELTDPGTRTAQGAKIGIHFGNQDMNGL